MERYHIIKDGTIIGSTANEQEAISFIKQQEKLETSWIKSNFWVIKGEEIFYGK